MVIALSAKMGCGKSYTAGILSKKLGVPVLSFGSAIKQEVANIYGIPLEDCFSHEGKAKVVTVEIEGREQTLALRELLQVHGGHRRKQDPLYWVKKTLEEVKMCGGDCIIDDVRDLAEADMVRKIPNSLLVRIEPYPGWEPGEYAEDVTETALDDYKGFDLCFRPKYGDLEKVASKILEEVGFYKKVPSMRTDQRRQACAQ